MVKTWKNIVQTLPEMAYTTSVASRPLKYHCYLDRNVNGFWIKLITFNKICEIHSQSNFVDLHCFFLNYNLVFLFLFVAGYVALGYNVNDYLRTGKSKCDTAPLWTTSKIGTITNGVAEPLGLEAEITIDKRCGDGPPNADEDRWWCRGPACWLIPQICNFCRIIPFSKPGCFFFVQKLQPRQANLSGCMSVMILQYTIPQGELIEIQKSPLGCALALAKGNLWLSSGPVVRHNWHGMTISTHSSLVISSERRINIQLNLSFFPLKRS